MGRLRRGFSNNKSWPRMLFTMYAATVLFGWRQPPGLGSGQSLIWFRRDIPDRKRPGYTLLVQLAGCFMEASRTIWSFILLFSVRGLILCLFLTTTSLCCLAQANRNEQVIEIPFEFYKNEIILQVSVNGKGFFNMMLDTGTDPSGVDISTAKEIGLKLHPLGKEISGGGTDSNLGYYTQFPLLQVGGLTAKNVDALAIDLSKISERLGKPLHGVLGHSLLNGRVVQIDYPHRVLRFLARSPLSKTREQVNTSKRTVMAFHYNDNVLIDDISVNGKKMVGNLDTGSSGSFNLTPAAVAYLGLADEVSKAPVGTNVGFKGASQNRKGKLRNVTIGGISIDEPDVIFFGKGTGRDKKPWGINIGNVFFKDFVMTIDYKRKLIALERP